jgi:hypothetical protein
METRKKVLGVDHPSTLTSMANLASTFWNQGRWKEAEKLEVQVMETGKTKLGPFTILHNFSNYGHKLPVPQNNNLTTTVTSSLSKISTLSTPSVYKISVR